MQGHHEYQSELFSKIDYEELIPRSHLLRRIDRVLDLSFLREITKPLYADEKGRPSVAPDVFIRMMLLQALYGIDSDRQLCEEVGYNLAYRWFCKLSFKDRVPDHSSMTRIRDRLGEKTYEIIFQKIVEQCKVAGLVKGEQIMIDGSVIRANASIYSMVERDKSAFDNHNDDDAPPPQSGAPIYSKDGLSNNDFRQRNIEGKKISNKTHISAVDPDSGLSGKAFEAKSLAYKTHTAIDASSRVIIDCHVTSGAVGEPKMLKSRIDAIEQNLDIKIGEIIADRGYGSADNLNFLEERGIQSNIPLWSGRTGETFFKHVEAGFNINEDTTEVHCPAGYKMKFSSYEEHANRVVFMQPRAVCKICPRFEVCLNAREQKDRGKRFAIPMHHQLIKIVYDKSKESIFKTKMWQRMWKMEGIFAEGKNNHGLRRARYRGRAKVQIQVYTISTVQNLKRLATALCDDFLTFTFKLAKKYFWSTETSFFEVIHRKNVEILV